MSLCLLYYPQRSADLVWQCLAPTYLRSPKKSLKAEILRSPLHETALAIKLLRLGSISHFLSKALEPPPIDAIIEAEVMLR